VNTSNEILPILGTGMAGGFYAGRIRIDGALFALIVAPKAEGQRNDVAWSDDYIDIPSAKSFNDGLANTNAMAEAGNELAKLARDLRIAGHDDWYLPSLDELEVIYRNLKPTTQENDCWVRSGINLNAVEPTHPYTPTFPMQTKAELFMAGGAEAFEPGWYWSREQLAAYPGFAWCQSFAYGGQGIRCTYSKLFARAVRRVAI
jgi:hypothetical protein